MQQVAAHKTDIAALPFSASGTAKAVGTGIGTQQQANNENNQAFNRLYQDAKTTKSDFVLNEKEDQVAQSRAANRSDRAAPQSSVSSDTIKNGKDRDAGHTDLPVRDEVTDIPAESEAGSHNANQEENATRCLQSAARWGSQSFSCSRNVVKPCIILFIFKCNCGSVLITSVSVRLHFKYVCQFLKY